MKTLTSLLMATLLLLIFAAGSATAATQTLTVTKTGNGTGTVTSSPAGINCGATCTASFTKNINVTLTAAANAGFIFVGWSGSCSGTGSCVVNMSANKTVTAMFNTPCSGTSQNLALNCPAIASSTQLSSTLPQYVDDGSTTTRWSSAQKIDPQWIYIDLGSTKTIRRVVLNWETAYASAYQIQTSPDASTWTTIFSTTTGDGGLDDLTVNGSGRYVRMNGTVRGTQFGYSLWEFEVYSWPPSYYSGPLGAKNPLPAPGHKLMVLWHEIGGHTWAQTQSEIQQRIADVGNNPFDGIGIHYGGGGTFGGVANCAFITPSEQRELWVHNLGSMPIVHWSPNASLTQINSGAWDACYGAVADYLKQFNFTIMLRLMWEFDGNWMLWQGCGQPFIDAWRRIVGIFQQHSATNVGFIWNPTENFNGQCADSSYPGDTYVDWVASDRYNPNNGTQVSPCHAGWAEWWELFNYYGNCTTSAVSKYATYSAAKPFFVGETGTKYDSADATRKGNWFRNIVNDSRAAPQMPNLIGISYSDGILDNNTNNWLVDDPATQPDAYQGWKDLVASSMFNP
jgi:NedA-like, galactose-binding domain/Glycosyl hydrolase family 26/Divergent InlB B-repeat domain